jgi:hypothetical protein
MSVVPPQPNPDSMGLLSKLSTWFGTILNDIMRLLAEPEGGQLMLAEQGWGAGAPVLPAALLGRLDRESQAGTDPSIQAEESFAEVLVALAAFTEALENVPDAQASPVTAAELVANLLDAVMALRMREEHPVLWAILRLLELLDDDGAQLANLSDLIGDSQKYLSGLVTGPGYAQSYQDWSTVIFGAVGTGLSFIPPIPRHGSHDPHGHDTTSFRSEVLYGWTPASALDHPNLMEILGRTLTWRLDAQAASQPGTDTASATPAVEEVVDLTFALVPGEHNQGSWGLFLRLSGATTISIPLGHKAQAVDSGSGGDAGSPGSSTAGAGSSGSSTAGAGSSGSSTAGAASSDTSTPPAASSGDSKTGWQFTITSTDGVALLALFSDDSFVRGAGDGYQLSIAVERPDDVSGSWVLLWSDLKDAQGNPVKDAQGNPVKDPHGDHLEIQHARLAATMSNDSHGWLFDVNAHSDHVILNIKIGSDSFLSSTLPPSLRFDSAIGMGYDNRRNVYLNGGVALVADLPVNVTIGPTSVFALKVLGLHLRINFAAVQGDPGSSPSQPSGTEFAIGLTVDAEVVIAGGVFIATVAGVGVSYAIKKLDGPSSDSGTAGHWHPSLTAIPPKGLGVQIVSDAVSGGGFIGHDPSTGEYTGALSLAVDIGPVQSHVTALGMLDTRIPDHDGDWALLVILAATFDPGFQIGAGFALTGLGGVLGINHTLDSDAIAAGLRTKALDTILFPPDPVGQAPHIFAVWRQTMPVSDGNTILGPMVQIDWGGPAHICSLELAVLIEFGSGPVQVVLLGTFLFRAPSDRFGVVRLRFEIYGRLTLNPFTLMLEAVLVDSKLGPYPITGGAVIAGQSGSGSYALISIGGFNPQYTPPAGLPIPDRLRIDISPSNNPRLRLEAYVALTTGTFQIGARAQLHAAAGPLAVDGWGSFDGLIQACPTWGYSIEVGFGVSLSYHSSPLFELSLDVLLTGPGPNHIHGYVSLSLLFFTLTLPIDDTWGDPAPPTAATAQPLTLVHDALSSASGWSASLPPGTAAVVVLKAPSGPAVPAHPLAQITCEQRIVPLGLNITHIGSQPLSAPTTVEVTAISLDGAAASATQPVTDLFTAAQFLDLTDDEALSRPSFEPMQAGLATGSQAIDEGNATVVATTYKTVAVDGATRTERPPWLLDLTHANAVLRPAAPAPPRPLPASFTVVSGTLRATATGAAATATLAAQQAAGARLFDAVGVAGVAK